MMPANRSAASLTLHFSSMSLLQELVLIFVVPLSICMAICLLRLWLFSCSKRPLKDMSTWRDDTSVVMSRKNTRREKMVEIAEEV
ncbi:unnamed protein product [Bursaphelenchus xylophilus]|uniref:(pine wood nematode) hypothetical protein n=1 Tax=Bursaphelenchus xylophilus TaxID=6326 RepID=A0A1I7SF27_BURXY|nr:unnamed protein product [Bursaphelenchus xylophilus]CAG9078956.1 unnamed protein product [Bursaphelenchus xylophilus]